MAGDNIAFGFWRDRELLGVKLEDSSYRSQQEQGLDFVHAEGFGASSGLKLFREYSSRKHGIRLSERRKGPKASEMEKTEGAAQEAGSPRWRRDVEEMAAERVAWKTQAGMGFQEESFGSIWLWGEWKTV